MTLAWLARLDSLKAEAKSKAQPLDEEQRRKTDETFKALKDAKGDYGKKLEAVARAVPDDSIVNGRFKGFRVSMSMSELPCKGWMWHLSMSGVGRPEDLDAILKRVGVPADVKSVDMPAARHWMWPAADDDKPKADS